MRKKTAKRLRRIVLAHLGRVKGGLCLAALCMLGSIAAELLSPWPLKIIFDHILLEKPLPAFLSPMDSVLESGKGLAVAAISAGILLIAAFKGAFAYGQLYVTSRIGYQLVYTLRRELFAHLQRLSLAFHNRARTGELLTKVTSDTNTLKDVYSGAALEFGSQVLTVIGMFTVLFLLNWKLSLIVLATFPLLCYAVFAIYRQIKASARKQREREGRIAARISEVLGSVQLVQAFARERHEQNRFDAESSETLAESVRTARLEARASRTVEIINAFGIWAAVLFGALRVIAGEMTPGEVLIFTAYLSAMYKPLRNMAKLSTQFSRAMVSAERIAGILEMEPEAAPEAVEDDAGAPAANLRGEIAFAQVSFRYNDDRPALRNVSFSVRPGQIVALVGASGAGKTTIASLLMRFYRPQGGAILLDGLNLNEYNRESLRNQIAVVLQDSLLFGVSIRENIAYGKPDATMEEIELAARHAHAHKFITAFPDGYDTILGERGATLSGGQRQRLCLARALIKESSIILLDEPTAAIDAESSALIERTIRNWRRGKTTLIITHKFSDMEKYDQIIVLKEGRVAEIGRHAELMAMRGYYFDLARLQGVVAPANATVNKEAAIVPLVSRRPERPRITQALESPARMF